ncbi:hypothetical protein K438DRAFT_1779385 [Mycena galopus ATCC 62051]|nr:hypothetical protein K438DRAFT_1779385 [Mycena galopus ATCC 62051]
MHAKCARKRILPGFPMRKTFAWFGALAVENQGDLSDKSNPWDLTIRNVDILDLRPRKPHLGTRVTLHHMEISIRERCKPNTHKSMMLKDLNCGGSTGNLEPILLVQLDFIKLHSRLNHKRGDIELGVWRMLNGGLDPENLPRHSNSDDPCTTRDG